MEEEEDTITFSQTELPCVSFAAFEDMRKRGHLCDLTIKVQNHSFSAHRVILAAAIPYFQSVFSNNAVETAETEIAVEDLDPLSLESLINFAYTGDISISLQNVQSLIVASQLLQLNQVRDACVEFLSKRLRIDNVLRLRTFACSFNNADLFESSNQFIRKNFEEFSKTDDFLSLPHSCVKEIISADDLNVSSEEVVFEALMKWVKISPNERQEALPDLLCEVRMIYLPIDYVIDQIDSEELVISSKLCRNLVNEVKSYHLLAERRLVFTDLKTRPRNHFNHDVYAICACETCGYSVQYFDLTREVWRILSSQKVKCKIVYTAIVVTSKMYMFLDEMIQTFDLKTREWEILEPRHKNIKGAAIVSNENKIYCFGSGNDNSIKKVRCFDTRLNEWLEEGTVRSVRYDHAAASLGDSIYVTGGYNGNTRITTVEKFSPSSGQWTDVAPLRVPRDEHGCTSLNGKIYVCGGKTVNSCTLNTAEVYDPITNEWNFISPMTNSRYRVSLVPHYNKIYAFEESGVEVYDPKNNQWKSSLSLPGGFRCATWGPSVCSK